MTVMCYGVLVPQRDKVIFHGWDSLEDWWVYRINGVTQPSEYVSTIMKNPPPIMVVNMYTDYAPVYVYAIPSTCRDREIITKYTNEEKYRFDNFITQHTTLNPSDAKWYISNI